MKEQFIKSVEEAVGGFLSQGQIAKLSEVLSECMQGYELTRKETSDEKCKRENGELLQAFLAAKKIEGCSEKTVHYYQSSVEKLFVNVVKNVTEPTIEKFEQSDNRQFTTHIFKFLCMVGR